MFRFITQHFKFFLASTFFISTGLFANQQQDHSLSSNGIAWENQLAKNTLLKRAPQWQAKDVDRAFKLYKTYLENSNQSATVNQKNLAFVHLHWGPVVNPFAIVARPAKVFVFIHDQYNQAMNSDHYSIAPLYKNVQDGLFYVFDANKSSPVLLDEWFNEIRKQSPKAQVTFNVCDQYASLPSDSCSESAYQNEMNSTAHQETLIRKNQPEIISAIRPVKEDWRQRAQYFKQANKTRLRRSHSTIYDHAEPWRNGISHAMAQQISGWPNATIINSNFRSIRDARYFLDHNRQHFLRRISWLYPDDGCWTRASAMIEDFFGPFKNTINQYARPAKIYVFGNLCAKTKNSPAGYVSWWYHTAPIVKDASNGETYVLDPSIDAEKPIKTHEWINLITATDGPCASSSSRIASYAVCNGYGSGPYSECQVDQRNEISAAELQPRYQDYERRRQTALDRDPEKVLGDSPPWH